MKIHKQFIPGARWYGTVMRAHGQSLSSHDVHAALVQAITRTS